MNREELAERIHDLDEIRAAIGQMDDHANHMLLLFDTWWVNASGQTIKQSTYYHLN